MITLYVFGPAFGLIDASPFCQKVHLLLKFAGLEYSVNTKGYKKAPKGKLPYIEDDGEIIADSTFIRMHIEKKYGFDYNAGLNKREVGIAWSVEKMFEDHLYWIIVNERWCIDDNFDRGPRMFFEAAPALIRPFVISMVKRNVAKSVYSHGIGRHRREETHILAEKAIDAVADVIGDNKYLMGDRLCGADATVFTFLETLACRHFDTKVIALVEKHQNLTAYRDRMRNEWFADLGN